MMGGGRTPGPIGLDEEPEDGTIDPELSGADLAAPGSIGMDDVPMVDKVVKDWEPPAPRTTPKNVVRGKTLAQVEKSLNAKPYWGRGAAVSELTVFGMSGLLICDGSPACTLAPPSSRVARL